MRSPTLLASAAMAIASLTLPAAALAGSGGTIPLSTAQSHVENGPAGPPLPAQAIARRTMNPSLEHVTKAAETNNTEPVTISPAPQTSVFGGTLNQNGVGPGNSTPPDPTGTIGPSHYVEATNNNVAVYTRSSLALVSQTSIDTFAGRAGSCDPQVQWDQAANRYFFTAIDCSGNAASYALLFGWSKTNDPSNLTSGWCKFSVNTSATGTNTGLSDYPKLGHNSQFEIIGTNDFNPSFTTARLWMVPRPANGVTTCTAPTVSHTSGNLLNADGSQAFTPIPMNEVDAPANGYVVASHYPSGSPASANKLMVWHVSGPNTSPPVLTADGDITVPSYTFPVNIPQPGTSNVLDSSDTRLTQGVGRADAATGGEGLWTQHTIQGSSGLTVVRWYEVNPVTMTLRQSGTIASSTVDIFNGAISPTNTTDEAAGIQYNTGSSAEFTKIKSRTRTAGDPLNAFYGELTLYTSPAADNDFSCSPCRWGDYAGLSPDMSNNALVWGTNQGNGSSGNPSWNTRNFAIDTKRTVVSISGSTLQVAGPSGVGAGVAVTKPTASTLQVTDSRSGVVAGAGCTVSNGTVATCPSTGITTLSLTAVGGGTSVSVSSPLV